ncbi:hypothetical protein pipiens_004875 [Culex pipiens pipiens]|uniref:CID domain-containing protein n=1 Tax=Culex pipiens pipiens TaxID=38569 RepID=A0ABD1CDZ6_CULPP
MQLDSHLKSDGFKSRVMNVFKAWEEWADYPKDFLLRLQHTFLGIAIVEKQPEEVPALLKGIADTDSSTPVLKHDIYNDGMPLNTTEDIDGVLMQSSEEKLKTGGSFQQRAIDPDGKPSVRGHHERQLKPPGGYDEEDIENNNPENPKKWSKSSYPIARRIIIEDDEPSKHNKSRRSSSSEYVREITTKSFRWSRSPLLQQKPQQARSVALTLLNQQQVYSSPSPVEQRFAIPNVIVPLTGQPQQVRDGHHDDGEIIAILCHSKTVCNQCARDRVLSSQSAVVEGPVLQEHLANLVPVAAVSATLSNPPKSAVSRPSSAGSLPSKSRKDFFEHKITLPAGGGSTTNIVRIDGR